MILPVTIEAISKAATVLSVLMKVYTIPCHDRGHINVVLVLQICTDSLQVLSGSYSETFPPSSDGTYYVGNIKFEEEMNVKTEEVIGNQEEEDEDLDIQGELTMDIKEEVS